MYKLNCLSILLILLAFFVFYNEFNKKLNYMEMLLLAVSFIAILRASYNYIQIDNANKRYEGFTNNNHSRKSNNKNNKLKNNSTFDDTYETTPTDEYDMIINSEESEDYFDNDNDNDNDYKNDTGTDTDNSYKNTIEKLSNTNKINNDAVSSINNLLGMNNQEFFYDIPTPSGSGSGLGPTTTGPTTTGPTTTGPTPTQDQKDEIKSIFSPKILIGKNGLNGNTNNGFGNTEKISQWNSVFSGSEFDVNGKSTKYLTDPTYTNNKQCGQYNSIREDKDGTLIVQDYKDAKTWVPGYTYLPPSNWDVPQKRSPVCMSPSPNSMKLTGLVDRGLPMNVLELNPQGQVATTEETVQLTNVGSLLPKFSYEEQPFSKPYV